MSSEFNKKTIIVHSLIPGGKPAEIQKSNGAMIRVLGSVIKNLFSDAFVEIQNSLPVGYTENAANDTEWLERYISYYNIAVRNCEISPTTVEKVLTSWVSERCTQMRANKILSLCIDGSVPDKSILSADIRTNSETYGEVMPDQLGMILSEITITPDDVFTDLGSGIGNVVLYTCAVKQIKKGYGIEMLSAPADHAKVMTQNFNLLMDFFAKTRSPFTLIHGDFLDELFQNIITKESTIIFINDYFFSENLRKSILTEILVKCRDGTRIVSTKLFAPIAQVIDSSNFEDPASIFVVKTLTSVANGVNWTAVPIDFFLHTINRSAIAEFLATDEGKKVQMEKKKSMKFAERQARKVDFGDWDERRITRSMSKLALERKRSVTDDDDDDEPKKEKKVGKMERSKTFDDHPTTSKAYSPDSDSDDDHGENVGSSRK